MVEKFIENGTITKLVERLGYLTGEKGRKKVDKQVEEEKEEFVSAEKKTLKRDNKRTGVGYSTGIGKIWNVNKYLKTKETKNTQITEIVVILNKILNNNELCEKYGFWDVLIESALIPMLENAFRSGSILELSKEYELYTSYLDFTQVLCKTDYFLPLLMPIGSQYEPK